MDELPPTTELVRSYTSRKFLLALISLAMVAGFGIGTIWFSVFESLLPTVIGGIIGILSVYYGGNLTGKFVAGKHVVEFGKVQQEQTAIQPPAQSAPKQTVGSDPESDE